MKQIELDILGNKHEHRIGKHVRLICDLKIGDKVFVNDEWRYQLRGKECIIQDIKFVNYGQTGVNIKIDQYENWIDSDWVNKIK